MKRDSEDRFKEMEDDLNNSGKSKKGSFFGKIKGSFKKK
jgi:hypothetical protein